MGKGAGIAEGVACLIKWLFDALFTLVAVVLGLISLAVPWRTYFACQAIATAKDKWRDRAIGQCFISLLDCILVPLSLVALAVPWRIPYAVSHYWGASGKGFDDESKFSFDLRFAFFSEFLHSLGDVIFGGWTILSICCPWRLPFVLQSYSEHWRNDTEDHENGEVYNFELRICMLTQGVQSFVDWLLVPVFAISFLRWPTIIGEWCSSGEEEGGEGEKTEKKKKKKEDRFHYRWQNRWAVVRNCGEAFLDFLFLPCIVLVLLSGWRARATVDQMRGASGLADNDPLFAFWSPDGRFGGRRLFERGGGRLAALGQLLSLLADLPFLSMCYKIAPGARY